MTYFLKVKLLGWPSEGPMVLPLILSLRFLIKEKEKKWFHKTHKTLFLGVIENSPSATCRLGAQRNRCCFSSIRGLRHSMARGFSARVPLNRGPVILAEAGTGIPCA